MSFFVLCSQKLDGECYMWFNKCQAEGDNHFTINLYTARVHLQLTFNSAVYQVPQILICRAAPQPVRPSRAFPRRPLFPFVLVGSHKPPACSLLQTRFHCMAALPSSISAASLSLVSSAISKNVDCVTSIKVIDKDVKQDSTRYRQLITTLWAWQCKQLFTIFLPI